MSKLMKTKRVDLSKYTLLELMFLLLELVRELQNREIAIPKIMDELNQKTYDFTHEIEFGDGKSAKEKVAFYNEMEKHFDTRRLAKQEMIVLDEVLHQYDWDFKAIIGKISSAVAGKQRYFKHKDGEPLVNGRKWMWFYQTCLKPYMR
ncbi:MULTISPECIES: hypothetical protein [unclassified Facklamia]|uniref:hypothetical protein n=1 Tax=Aerococcaceae TaxID=186827 RepID=UPI0013BA2268|nr:MULTISPECIES: hypothetical protein [unclassified Facklamia]NEW65285.1 hypothetical protein [Facklamia sp. 252]NEW68735.1 hypothetical protein [Facklamia sp. 253]QQD66124.1 hypothetical protein JDW14_03185 [Aerococcaceae bacterium zg-252]